MFKALFILSVLAVYAPLVTSQSLQEMPPSPAPSMDKGGASSLEMSVAMICLSLMLSLHTLS